MRLVICLLMLACSQPVFGHGLHFRDLTNVTPGSLSGMKFTTTDGRCWQLYKAGDLCHRQLHYKEISCDEYRIDEAVQTHEEVGEAVRKDQPES